MGNDKGQDIRDDNVKRMTIAPETARRDRLLLAIPDASAVLSRFESLGDNCEFGIVQVKFGVDIVGFFRYACTPLVRLRDGLESDFEAINDPDMFEVLTSQLPDGRREFITHQIAFGIISHTLKYDDVHDAKSIKLAEFEKSKFLRRKLIEDFEDGQKIFVRKSNDPAPLEEIKALWILLQKHGPNRLLWVVLADDAHLPGHVEWILPGLMKGYIDRFAPYELASDVSEESWVTLCRNALALFDSSREAE